MVMTNWIKPVYFLVSQIWIEDSSFAVLLDSPCISCYNGIGCHVGWSGYNGTSCRGASKCTRTPPPVWRQLALHHRYPAQVLLD
ncbi:hypothetical protein AALO_G00171250 [Alosa alosa]|uniref:Uncharacterized protein n=1 Tax=Alosa alosa TaxID=278164 RepID=A0AAV6GD43_9TELE|nr:hypothetical protein AALO_G00171250 [Alosa alosa]